MSIAKKHIYWSVGIAVGIIAIGGIVHFVHKTPTKPAAKPPLKLTSWIKPVAGKVSSKFGYRVDPVLKLHQFHNGIDLPVPVNTQVKSPQDGTILEVYNNKEGGNQVLIKHNDGFTSGYAHLNKPLVKKGDKVKKGQIVALSGNTGKSTGPHVHMTLKDTKGNYLDAGNALYA